MDNTSPQILLIFDIDGTLTYSDGATGRAFGAAFTQLTGVNIGPEAKRPFGMTDPQIFRDLLHHANIQPDNFQEMFLEFQKYFVPLMRVELANAKGARLLSGVQELLDTLSNDRRFALALGTGNMELSGREKLRIHGADHYFPVGGFGSDAEDRSEVLRIAWKRAQKHWNTRFPLLNTWVIGDTPKDIAAGKSLGTMTLGIASGVYSTDDLLAAKPNAVLNSLENRDQFLQVVLQTNRRSLSCQYWRI